MNKLQYFLVLFLAHFAFAAFSQDNPVIDIDSISTTCECQAHDGASSQNTDNENHISGVDDATKALHEVGIKEVYHVDSDTTAVSPTLSLSSYEPHHGMDWRMFKSVTNPNTKPYTFLQDQTWVGLPLFAAGLIAKSEKTAFRQDYNNPNTRIRLIKYNFHNEIDNYTQYVPLALTIGLHLGGYEGRSDWPRFWASAASSAAIMAGLVNGLKYTTSEMRPDGSTRNSWPSGHTATAFLAATILHKEYGLTRSPWFSVGAYTMATATGVMRVLNNRHWISDVLSGAGIGILSVELGYGICDLLFKGRGLLRNDLAYYPDLRKSPSFFAVSMGIGFGNKNLTMPAFDYDIQSEEDIDPDEDETELEYEEPLRLKFRAATVVGAEGAWFFCPYVGIGGRLRVKSTPINGWSAFVQQEDTEIREMFEMFSEYDMSVIQQAAQRIDLTIESDHITEFAADAGIYFNLPLSSRFALGSKLLIGQSIMDDIDVNAHYSGKQLDDELNPTDKDVSKTWDYIGLGASNSMKFGTGISLTYAHKNAFSWRVFCDYDYARKTFKAEYCPSAFVDEFCPSLAQLIKESNYDINKPVTSTTRKSLHQWVIGGALCLSF